MDTAAIPERIRTPRKHRGLVLRPSPTAGSFDSRAVDCPFPVRHERRFWMTYVGWDGVGYQTGLASSHDLFNWQKEGLLLGRGPKGSPTEFNAALTCVLRDNDLFGPGTLRKVGGRFVGTYHAYPNPGYEAGPGVIGLCWSEDLRSWRVAPPVLRPDESCPWEAGGLYKSWLMESDGTYYLFYNARDRKDKCSGPWKEETGVAFSTDLTHWQRHPSNPLLETGAPGEFDDRFASDPCVFRHGDAWVMFYYGNSSDGHARDGVAFSTDLIDWRKGDEALIDVGPPGSVDSKYAHKPGIIADGDRLYHFYCAVSEAEGHSVRGIAVATG